MTLVDSVLSGNTLALARVLTQVENEEPAGRSALDQLFPHTGKAHLIGITGASGTGKSSLVNRLALHLRHQGEHPSRVAIVAVDPSSPFSGGAVLGDRVRMQDLSGDPGVFIRSTASRGSLGGLARTTSSIVQVFDAAGFGFILIETVGAGQAEVDIARLAHTTLVVEAPGLGDEVQSIKAGILEIADILVVNKADLPGAEKTVRALKTMLNLSAPVTRPNPHPHPSPRLNQEDGSNAQFWKPSVCSTVATNGTGIDQLAGEIEKHADYLHKNGGWEEREQTNMEAELEAKITERLTIRLHAGIADSRFREMVTRLIRRELSPRMAAELLVAQAEPQPGDAV